MGDGRYHVLPLSPEARANRGSAASGRPFSVRFWVRRGPYYLTRDARDAGCAACAAGDCLQLVEVHFGHELVIHDHAREMN